MIVKNFGIELHLIDESKLEILRRWRNSNFVQQHMQKTVKITKEMQQKWYSDLDKGANYYFLILEQGEYIGCCNIKNISNDGLGEGGVFLSEPKYQNGLSAARAVFLMYKWAFDNKIIKHAKSEILANNKKAIRFNKMLGFTLEESGHLIFGSLDESSFVNRYNKYLNVLRAVHT